MTSVPQLHLSTFDVPLRHVVRHAAARHERTCNVIVMVVDGAGHRGWGEGCPRSYVTGETVEGALAYLRQRGPAILAGAQDPAALRAWVAAHEAEIDAAPAAFSAIVLALLDLFGRREGVPVEDVLGMRRVGGALAYTAVLGEAPAPATALLGLRYRLAGFRDAKLKVRRDVGRAARNLRVLRGFDHLRIDANNAWPDAESAPAALDRLPRVIAAVEEPVAAGDITGAGRVSCALDLPVVLDESLLRAGHVRAAAATPGRWIANLRVSKLGGLIRSIVVARVAEEAGMAAIVGAQVDETSLLARAALALEGALARAPWAREGAFGTRLLRRDLVDEPIMFGRGGRLEAAGCPALARPGLGLDVRTDRPTVLS